MVYLPPFGVDFYGLNMLCNYRRAYHRVIAEEIFQVCCGGGEGSGGLVAQVVCLPV